MEIKIDPYYCCWRMRTSGLPNTEPQNKIDLSSQTQKMLDTRGLLDTGITCSSKTQGVEGAEQNAHSLQTGRFQRKREEMGLSGLAYFLLPGEGVLVETLRKVRTGVLNHSPHGSLLSSGPRQGPCLLWATLWARRDTYRERCLPGRNRIYSMLSRNLQSSMGNRGINKQ